MIIKEIKISELQDFVKSEIYLNSKEIPITVHRAHSQIKNPRADSNDIVLIAAYNDNSELLGYVGALPDTIRGKHKIVWNSCWYANSKLSKTIALPLFLLFVKKWKGKILFRDLTNHTRKIIDSLSYFKVVKTEDRTRYYTSFYMSDLLPQKWPILSLLKIPFQIIDLILNSYILFRRTFWKKSHIKGNLISSQLLNQIDDQTIDFIQKRNKNELLRRDKDELNWILNYPWVINETNKNKVLFKKYYFSSVAKSFNYFQLKILDSSDQIGFLLIKEREHHFEVPYFYGDDKYLKEISTCLINFLHSMKVRSLTIVNSRLLKSLEEINFPFIHSKTQIQELFASKELIDLIGSDSELQDGDSDTAFT